MTGIDHAIAFIEHILSNLIAVSIIMLELIGVIVILVGAIQSIIHLFKRCDKRRVKLELAESLAFALEFKLGSEILRTVQVRQLSEIAVVGAIILLRALLSLLIRWEIRSETEETDEFTSDHGGKGEKKKRLIDWP